MVYERNTIISTNYIKNLLALDPTFHLYYHKYCTDPGLLIRTYQCYLVCNVLRAAEPGIGDQYND